MVLWHAHVSGMTISHNPCIGHSLEAIHIHGIHFYYKCIILMLCLLAAVLYSLKPERAEALVADRRPTGNKTRHSQGFCHELRTI